MIVNNYAPIMEIFTSIQGEGQYVGIPVVFVRVAGCDQRCGFCDTKESWTTENAFWMDVESVFATILEKIDDKKINRVVITGGEPFKYSEFLSLLIHLLIKANIHVSIETSGYVKPTEINKIESILASSCAFVTLSPKFREPDSIYFDRADEIKLLVGAEIRYDVGFDFPLVQDFLKYDWEDRHAFLFFQPVFNNASSAATARAVERAIPYCYQYGGCLSLQTHKMGGFK